MASSLVWVMLDVCETGWRDSAVGGGWRQLSGPVERCTLPRVLRWMWQSHCARHSRPIIHKTRSTQPAGCCSTSYLTQPTVGLPSWVMLVYCTACSLLNTIGQIRPARSSADCGALHVAKSNHLCPFGERLYIHIFTPLVSVMSQCLSVGMIIQKVMGGFLWTLEIGNCHKCLDTVGWAAGRASSL